MNIIEFHPKIHSAVLPKDLFLENDIENLIKGIFEPVENEGG